MKCRKENDRINENKENIRIKIPVQIQGNHDLRGYWNT